MQSTVKARDAHLLYFLLTKLVLATRWVALNDTAAQLVLFMAGNFRFNGFRATL